MFVRFGGFPLNSARLIGHMNGVTITVFTLRVLWLSKSVVHYHYQISSLRSADKKLLTLQVEMVSCFVQDLTFKLCFVCDFLCSP